MRHVLRFVSAGLVFAATLLVAACNVSFSTAHITGLVIAKDKAGTQSASTFSATEPVYAKATVANVPGKVTLKWHLVADKVTGIGANSPLPEADMSFELAGDGNSTYTLTPPAAGWPAGTYSIHVSMLDESGAEKDKRSGTFTVAGAAAAQSARTAPAQAEHAAAGAAEFTDLEFSDSKSGDPVDSFSPDTPEIFLGMGFKGVAQGSKITATWIAVKVDGAPPGTTIASTDVGVETGEDTANFSMTKPTKGWPIGDYRVDISVDGKVVKTGRFEVEQ